jgi:glycosyltransferase involved in cell wall biosynthesis
VIVHLGPAELPVTYNRGGAIQRRMMEIARQQSARGHKVAVYSAGDENGLAMSEGVEIRSLACRKRNYLRDLEYLKKALRDLQGQKVDVLHFHSLPEGAAFAGATGQKKFLSYDYFTFRRGKKTPLFWWYRQALRKFSSLLPVSRHCWNGSRDYWGLDGVPANVLYNGVNTEQFCPDAIRGLEKKRALGIESEQVILYVGRVCEQKGTDVLVRAYLQVKKMHPGCRLVVAGPADAFGHSGQNELTKRIAECGGLYLGAVEEKELSAVYNMADVFVMPTREIEMFGMAAVEAQSCGKPVIASRHGGLPEVISATSGLFFPNGDDAALAGQLRSLLCNPELRQSLATAARTNANRFAWTAIVNQLEEIYSRS